MSCYMNNNFSSFNKIYKSSVILIQHMLKVLPVLMTNNSWQAFFY